MENQKGIEDRLYSITERLTALFPKKIDLSLERIERFLSQLGNPHLNIPPAIHVAGTNGKGSSIAFLRSCLEHNGFSCHAMTSPHLIRFNERIILGGKEITTDYFMDILDECERVNAGDQISYFEIVIAATLLTFSRETADFSLIETGLGGRLDATNVIKEPKATLITTISFDHTDYLGKTLKEIAFEKAGIMKKNAPCITGAQTEKAIDAGVMQVFEDKAKELDISLIRYGDEYTTKNTDTGFTLTLNGKSYAFPNPSLVGEHQIRNAGAVLSTLLTMLPDSNIDKLRTAIKNTKWRGRLQKINDLGRDVWLDGGHNDSAGEVLATQSKVWNKQDQKPLHLIIGMVNRKDPKEFLIPLLPHIASITTITIPQAEASFTAQELADKINKFCDVPVNSAISYKQAILSIDSNSRILIAGSLYLAGFILAQIENTLPQQNEW